MHWISPLASAGFNMFAASMAPAEFPAPTMVCSSSMKSMTSLFLASSVSIALMRSSNCPLYFVPATSDAMSSDTTLLSNSTRETLRCTILSASPSTIADFPTPGSPISTGLFFLRRLSIWARRSISVSRPTTGSSRFSSAAFVMSMPNLSSTGVSLPRLEAEVCLESADEGSAGRFDGPKGCSASSSSSSSPENPAPIRGASATLESRLYSESYVTPALRNASMYARFCMSALWKRASSRCSESTVSLRSILASSTLSFMSLFDMSLTDTWAAEASRMPKSLWRLFL